MMHKLNILKMVFLMNLHEKSIVYTSGTGAIFKSGIPIGKVKIIENDKSKKFNVEFYSDFSQLKYVFAEVITKKEIEKNKSKKMMKYDNKIKIQWMQN